MNTLGGARVEKITSELKPPAANNKSQGACVKERCPYSFKLLDFIVLFMQLFREFLPLLFERVFEQHLTGNY